jgi:hypothetical protein
MGWLARRRLRVVARRHGWRALPASCPRRGESLEHGERPGPGRDQVPGVQAGLEQERYGCG